MEKDSIKPKKTILNYINVYRGLAILLIVAGHTLQFGADNTLLRKITFEVFAGGTALFVFISGFLFQHLSYKFEYKGYLSKKWKNVILPYIITAIPGIIMCLCIPNIYKNPFDGLNPLLQTGMFLTTGRVHNVPTWFIPMIVIFFIASWFLLFLERKNILYKLLPLLLAVTVFMPRGDIEPEWVMNLSYWERYLEYVKFFFTGFIHFSSLYVLGMYFSKYKDKIDFLYNTRFIIFILMIIISAADIFINYKYNIVNGSVSKIFLTVLLLGYLKHYDEQIKACLKLNNVLDFLAKYSFGLFFIHWYYVFAFNYFLKNIIPHTNSAAEMSFAGLRFVVVLFLSLLTLYLIKNFLQKLKAENTRMFIGV